MSSAELPNPSDHSPRPEGADQRRELEEGIGPTARGGLFASAAGWAVAGGFVGALLFLAVGALFLDAWALALMVALGAFAGSVYGFVNGGISRGKSERESEEGL